MSDRAIVGQPRLMMECLALAARDWSVLPFQPCRKVLTVRGWDGQATREPIEIRKVRERAGWNIGVACEPSNLVVVDLDGADERGRDGPSRHGPQALVLLAAAAGEMVRAYTVSVLTPKGQHFHFEAPSGNSAGRRATKVETSANGVVAAVGVCSRARVLIEVFERTTWRARFSPVRVSFPGEADPARATCGRLRR